MYSHPLQLAILMNLELVFYLSYIVFLPITAVKNSVKNPEISAMPRLPHMHQVNLLTLRWRSFSRCSGEHVAVVLASKGCQYVINGCLQPIRKEITQDSKLTIVDTPLTLILRIRQQASWCSVSPHKQTISDKWRSTTNRNINSPRCEANNDWRSIDTHSQDVAWSMLR